MHTVVAVVFALAGGAAATLAGVQVWYGRRTLGRRSTVTRIEAQMSAPTPPKFTPATSTAMRRDVQEVFETREAVRDLEVLDRFLGDIRDLTNADEAIFWRWIEARETLVPNAWSTERASRPAFFNMRAWGQLVRWTAEECELQLTGDVEGFPVLVTAPVLGATGVYGVLTLSAAAGLRLDNEGARDWMPRFAAQVASLIQLFELRSAYGRHMRQSEALLDAVQRLHGHRTAETLARALCEMARDVTSAPVASVVRWNAQERCGVLQAVSPSIDLEAGFHVTADALAGRACDDGLPLLLDDARAATAAECPLGGLPRAIGSLLVMPVTSGEQVIGALVIEGRAPGDVSRHELRNIELLVAVARGPLEIIWEIEDVSRRARTDALTGLANRRHFDEQLRRVIAETDRFGGSCSLILVDLDHFKAVNDAHGHEAGDTVLRHVSQVLGDAVRTIDICARYGGEEIAVLLSQTSQQGATELADRLRQTVESRPASREGQAIPMTASFGVATYPHPVPYGDWLVLAADHALYEAKAAGRNCVKVIQPSHITPALYKPR